MTQTKALACVACRQRKLRCNRQTPCANCTRSGSTCVPGSTAQRQRKPRFPERQLLNCIRSYESLLRQHKIPFQPLHDKTAVQPSDSAENTPSAEVKLSSPSIGSEAAATPGVKNFWDTINRGFRDGDSAGNSEEDAVPESAVKREWDQFSPDGDQLLFGPRSPVVDLTTAHPTPVESFKLWQIYLDNVNPLLKVTHTPTLQGRFVEAIGDIKSITPSLEALMFSIYSIAILSLTDQACEDNFAAARQELLQRFQLSCQQALWKCNFLRSDHRDSLTALYLYLVSIRSKVAPQALTCMLGVAIRISQRFGIDSESSLATKTPFEAEMWRRLWWALAIYDARVQELASVKASTLNPIWDCAVPLNTNDSDLRPEMKEASPSQNTPSESIHVVVRSAIAHGLRHTAFHLDLTRPILKSLEHKASYGSEIEELQDRIESQYLRHCDKSNSVHFMTIWTARTYLTKLRLLECQSLYLTSTTGPSNQQLEEMANLALRVLECDTTVMTSPLTTGFVWLNHANFPFPAYLHLLQDLKKRPGTKHAQQAWETMSANFDTWFGARFRPDSPFFRIFARLVLKAWEAGEAVRNGTGGGKYVLPKFVGIIRDAQDEDVPAASDATANTQTGYGSGIENLQTTMPVSVNLEGPYKHADWIGYYELAWPDMYNDTLGTNVPAAEMMSFDWAGMRGWSGSGYG
ncbi:hypothetical protein BDY17DRAFT_165541 [Neohortaea acidophila]|uniref:Zn(2)-C6 fungal-type domain-containing protein n=1 Tax=Neohortaea acidophila TaxID=245834 RepID=A0A6A6PST6_9PEZI|nr:uncharacterized protein BDY17DRAFT_165541 [Neohortaea acidophila]KAF2482744.1 hypothetical protein BDY17DRAFT_165541 [Neohortaea acidophila]